MHRYYVSFSHQSRQGFGIGALDVTAEDLITNADELLPVRDQLTARGYHAVTILAFSLYATPKPTPAVKPHTNPTPQQHPRRRPSPRPGRHS